MATIAQQRPTSAPPTIRNPQFRTPLFLAGLGLAIFAFLAMFTFGLIFASRSGTGQKVTVVVAATQIEQKQLIDAEMLKTVQIQGGSAFPGAYSSVTAVIGKYATVAIPQGQAITPNLVSTIPQATVNAPIDFPSGYIVVSIVASEQQGVAGYLQQNDYIDVYVTMDKGAFSEINPAAKGSVTARVFEKVYVVRVGPDTNATRSGQGEGVTSSLVVMMSPCDAAFMTWFGVNAQVKYALVSFNDYPKNLPNVDPGPCTWANATSGVVGPRAVENRYHFLAG